MKVEEGEESLVPNEKVQSISDYLVNTADINLLDVLQFVNVIRV